MDEKGFLPMGYQAKQKHDSPAALNQGAWQFPNVPATLSGCIVANFCDYLTAWNHNGFWLFNTPQILAETALTFNVDPTPCRLLYAEVYHRQFSEDGRDLGPVVADDSLDTAVLEPTQKTLLGYEPVTFTGGNLPECSYLTCNGLFKDFENLTPDVLFPEPAGALEHLQQGRFSHCEPGPVRLIAIYDTPWPTAIIP